MDSDIAIVGIGETSAVRRSDKDVRALVIAAVAEALADAGISPSEVDGIVTDAGVMPASVPHEYVAAQFGIERRFDASMSFAGAGIVAAPMLAALAIQSGQASVIVSYFGVDWGSRPSGPYGFHDAFPAKSVFEKPYGFVGQPAYFATWANRYMYEFGLKPEQLGHIAVQQRANAIRNGRAQNMKPMSLEDYLDSPMISDPLRFADCCLISDGAGAFVMTSAARARDCSKTPVYVRGIGYSAEPFSSDDIFTQKPDQLTLPGARAAREQAEQRAGISLSDTDFGEVYDCFTISYLMQIEDLGFCKKGEAGEYVAAGNTAFDGPMPLNTHGGLLSYSYLVGIEHLIEAVRQLRHEAGAGQIAGAETGFVTGLSLPEYSVLILGR